MNVSVKLLLKLKVEQAMWEIGMDFEKETLEHQFDFFRY